MTVFKTKLDLQKLTDPEGLQAFKRSVVLESLQYLLQKHPSTNRSDFAYELKGEGHYLSIRYKEFLLGLWSYTDHGLEFNLLDDCELCFSEKFGFKTSHLERAFAFTRFMVTRLPVSKNSDNNS